MHLFKFITFALFISAFLIKDPHIFAVHLLISGMMVLVAVFPNIEKHNFYKEYWMYFMYFSALFDLWMGHLESYLYLVGCRFCFMMMKEFTLLIMSEKYGFTNNSLNEEVRAKIEKIETKFA